jgi:predicted RNA-binding Zn-ribbon protein involved in translation (DUF1610 family)
LAQRGVANWKQYPHWARGPARVVGDEVVLDEDRAEPYYIFEPTDLLFDLADLGAGPHKRDPREAVSFVRRYGLLWHGAERLGSGQCREPLEKWWSEAGMLAVTGDLYMRLRDSLQAGSADPLRDSPVDFTSIFDSEAPSDEGLMGQASVFLAEAISMKLERCDLGVASSVQLEVVPRGPGIFLLSQNPPNLVSAAYAQLALAMVNRAPIQECPGCGRMFVPQSGKQKYHSPSCANTSRWRRWKERQDHSVGK